MLQRLADLDRRWIFLMVALAIIIPLWLFPLRLPIEPSKPARDFHRTLGSLPPGSLVCISFDYGPATAVELHPMAEAALRQAFARNLRVVAIALLPEGPLFARRALGRIGAEAGKTYGVDYVNLGYKVGGDVVLASLGTDFRNQYTLDIRGTRVDDLPIMKDVQGWGSFGMVITLSAGKPGIIEHVRVVASQYDRPLGGGVTAVQAPEVYPFLNSGQLVGLLSGLRGAAEYEKLVGVEGTATPGMDAQSIVHFMLAGFIVFANVAYFAGRRRRRR